MREFDVVPKTFQNSKQAALVLLFRWTIKVREATPVCLSQKLVSLFHLLPVGIHIPDVVVGMVLIVFRNLQTRPFFNFLFLFSLNLIPDVVSRGVKAKLARSFLGLAKTSPVLVAEARV